MFTSSACAVPDVRELHYSYMMDELKQRNADSITIWLNLFFDSAYLFPIFERSAPLTG